MFGFFPLKLNKESYCLNQDLKKLYNTINYCIRMILNETCDNKIYKLDQIGYTLYLFIAKQI